MAESESSFVLFVEGCGRDVGQKGAALLGTFDLSCRFGKKVHVGVPAVMIKQSLQV